MTHHILDKDFPMVDKTFIKTIAEPKTVIKEVEKQTTAYEDGMVGFGYNLGSGSIATSIVLLLTHYTGNAPTEVKTAWVILLSAFINFIWCFINKKIKNKNKLLT